MIYSWSRLMLGYECNSVTQILTALFPADATTFAYSNYGGLYVLEAQKLPHVLSFRLVCLMQTIS